MNNTELSAKNLAALFNAYFERMAIVEMDNESLRSCVHTLNALTDQLEKEKKELLRQLIEKNNLLAVLQL